MGELVVIMVKVVVLGDPEAVVLVDPLVILYPQMAEKVRSIILLLQHFREPHRDRDMMVVPEVVQIGVQQAVEAVLVFPVAQVRDLIRLVHLVHSVDLVELVKYYPQLFKIRRLHLIQDFPHRS